MLVEITCMTGHVSCVTIYCFGYLHSMDKHLKENSCCKFFPKFWCGKVDLITFRSKFSEHFNGLHNVSGSDSDDYHIVPRSTEVNWKH